MAEKCKLCKEREGDALCAFCEDEFNKFWRRIGMAPAVDQGRLSMIGLVIMGFGFGFMAGGLVILRKAGML